MSHYKVLSKERTAVAVRMLELPDADGFPTPSSWEVAAPLRFNTDWQGKNADPERETEVRLLWTPESLFVRFRAKYRAITVFSDAEPNGRRDQLWDRDVAEVFLQPDPSHLRSYKEFEVSPNGFWIDLDIAPGEKNLGRGACAAHGTPSRPLRSCSRLEGKFLPRRRNCRAALLFRMAAHANAGA